jgi:hypothetical protein
MLLVHPDYRHQGIGSTLLNLAVQSAKHLGTIRLDATPAGINLYKNKGFIAEYNLIRMVRDSRMPLPNRDLDVVQMDRRMLNAITRYDANVFGAERYHILSSLLNNSPEYAFSIVKNKEANYMPPRGFCMGRSGTKYEQIGPIVAESDAEAYRLLVAVMHNICRRPLILDVPLINLTWIKQLTALGFTQLRGYTRMSLGSRSTFGHPEKQYAIAGPEIG